MDNKLDVTAYGEMESNPYIVNVSNDKSNWEPVASAATKEEGIEVANSYLDRYKFSEVVYMPEDDLDTNDVVWRSSGEDSATEAGLSSALDTLSNRVLKIANSTGKFRNRVTTERIKGRVRVLIDGMPVMELSPEFIGVKERQFPASPAHIGNEKQYSASGKTEIVYIKNVSTIEEDVQALKELLQSKIDSGKPAEEEYQEEMYGFEAMSRTGLEDLTKALSSAIKTAGSVGVIQFLLNEDLGTDFEDQITFIKNTTDLSDSNKVLNEILQAAETLLDDVQIELLVQSLEGPEEMAEEGNPEEFEEEYQEPEDWSSVDSEPAGEEEIVEEPTDEGNAESGESGLEDEEDVVEDDEGEQI